MKNKDITKVITQGRAFKSGSFLLKTSENTENVAKNIAFIASKKIFKTAVLRNKVKRKLKAAIVSVKKKEKGLKLDKSTLFIFTGYESILDRKQADLAVEMENILQKSGMLKL